MKNQNTIQALEQKIKDLGNVSEALITVHNLCVHNIDLTEINKDEQSKICMVWQIAQAIKAVECQIKAESNGR